jgi:hypothetical protein
MTSLRRFEADDLFKFANVNLDHLTETVCLFICAYLATRAAASSAVPVACGAARKGTCEWTRRV